MSEPRKELLQHKMLVTQHLEHPFSYFMAHLASQDADTNRLLTNTASNGDLQGASALGASPLENSWRSSSGSPPSWEHRPSKGWEMHVSIIILLQVNTEKGVQKRRGRI